MYIKLIFKYTINNKQIYSPRLCKYRVFLLTVYTHSTRLRFGNTYTHSFKVQTHIHDVPAPCLSFICN